MAGLVFGLYLTFSYLLFRVNADWTYSAQRIAGYKNFLRMRFEPDKLTIYPIGLDKVPRRRRWWRSGWLQTKDPKPGQARVEPCSPLAPRLIEGPIVIHAHEVINFPREPTD